MGRPGVLDPGPDRSERKRKQRSRIAQGARSGLGPTYSTMPPPIIAHVHLPRCAGTSVWEALWVHFAGKVLRLQGFEYGLQDIESAFEADPSLMAVSSHQLRFQHPKRIAGRDVHYVTFLREPAEQICSWIRYIRASYSKIPDNTRALMDLPHAVDRIPLDEAVDKLVTCLTWPSGRSPGGGWFRPCAFFGFEQDPRRVLETLSTFDVVGTVEDLDAGMAEVSTLLGGGLMKPRRVNVSEPLPDLQTSLRIQDFLDDALGADQEVYRWVAKPR